MTSPYRAVLGAAFDDLHPRLQAYFDAIPSGSVGRGSGVFDTVGTPRRWLWPVLALFARARVLFPVWERDVPFTVTNRPVNRPDGSAAVAAERVFALPGRSAVMVDEIGIAETGSDRRRGGPSRHLVDRLGEPVRTEARFRASVRDGGLRLRSTRVHVVVAGLRIRIPSPIAPIVVLTERWDEETGRQRVSITVTLPIVGRIYQYGGLFRYDLAPETEQRRDGAAEEEEQQ